MVHRVLRRLRRAISVQCALVLLVLLGLESCRRL